MEPQPTGTGVSLQNSLFYYDFMPQNDQILCFFMPNTVKFHAKSYAFVLNFMIILCYTYCDYNLALKSPRQKKCL